MLTRATHAVAPVAMTRAMARMMSVYFGRAEWVGTSDGILYEPSADTAVIDGGLRKPGRRAAVAVLAGLVGTTGLVAATRRAVART